MYTRHFYLEIKNNGTFDFGINSIYHNKKNTLLNGKEKQFLDQLPEILNNRLNQHSNNKKKAILQIHGFMGQRKNYHTKRIRTYDSYFLNKENKDIMISIIWNPIVNSYPKNWKRALNVGQSLSKPVNLLIDHLKKAGFINNLCCHSMGNRILEGITTQFESYHHRFENIILTGSDLHPEALEKGNPLSRLNELGKNICIYMNPGDKMLQFSKIMHGKNRIGLSGWNNEHVNYKLIDVSKVIDHKIDKTEILDHKYHVNNITVLKDISWQIQKSGIDSPYRLATEDGIIYLENKTELNDKVKLVSQSPI